MLERYFTRPDTVDRIRASWIGGPIERYIEWLTECHYSTRTIWHRVPVLFHFGQYAWEQGARTPDELPTFVGPFTELWVRDHGRNCTTSQALKQVAEDVRNPIQQMLRLAIPGYYGIGRKRKELEPLSNQAPGFFQYLKEERGLRETSIEHYRHYLRGFEAFLDKVALDSLSELSPPVLSAFITDYKGNLSKSSLTGLCSVLSVFLKYLHRERLTDKDLSGSIGSPKIYRHSDIPRSITWDEVRKMLDVVDCRTPLGKRDYAILLLFVTYGLRAREVAGLTLDDIDWKRDRLRIPERKAGHSTAYPLSSIVGEAIVDYLRHGRPQTSDRHVFFRVLAPPTPYTYSAVSGRVSHYLHKAGIRVHRAGSHTLRHTCVQRLVDSEFSLKSIGDYVGHRSASSTGIYTKVSIEALREVAMGDGEVIS
ncbi:MAG: integrase [Deltaproteobacteria bacterium]|nr:integrase [Deltaproteobacteria bacterium]